MSWEPGEPVELETERYFLRSLKSSDATERYLTWLQDPEVNKFLEVRVQETSIESIRDYIESHDNRSSFLLGIFEKDDGQHVGNYSARCDLHRQNARLGVMIGDRQHWGRRTVLETRAAVLDFLFSQDGIIQVHGACYVSNIPAVYNFKAQGYQNGGISKVYSEGAGKMVDSVRFAMFKEDWLAKR